MIEVFVYGAGYVGKKVYEKVSEYYSELSIIGYIDEEKKGNLYDIPIIRLEDYNRLEVPVIIALERRKSVLQVYGNLRKKGAKNIYMYQNRNNPRYEEQEFLSDECIKILADADHIIPHIETHAVDYCNLNCKACIHFSALYKKEEQDTLTVYSDIEKIRCISRDILSFYIMGGEPLLREDLSDIVETSRKSFPNSDIQLLTNGILISERLHDLLNTLHKTNVTVTISEYSATKDHTEKMLRVLEKYKVSYIIRTFDTKSTFIKTLSLNKETPYKKICICDGCVNIYKGRIARCPAVMYLDKLNDTFSLELPNSGIYQIEEFSDALSLNSAMEAPIALCDHCVEYKVNWAQCGKKYKLEDFVVV